MGSTVNIPFYTEDGAVDSVETRADFY